MRRRRPQPEESVHHERWLVSYADFMTLMFALFVVLFASAYKDKHALDKVSSAVRNGFQDLQAFSPINDPHSPTAPSSQAATPHRTSAGVDVDDLQQKLHSALGKEIEHKEVVLHMTQEGFVISLHELGFFDSGEAQLLPGAADKIKRLASVLMGYGLEMRVEGHSDNVPIHNQQFNSNWDLSTARASAVAMMLLKDQGFDPSRLSIAGYGEYHPTASNDTPEGRRANRRVDIVILSASKPPAAAAY
ncbi:MAG TPA: OmpA family protein [Acidobacteriaceae bacterium]|jgi:chemotaxis protein MotB